MRAAGAGRAANRRAEGIRARAGSATGCCARAVPVRFRAAPGAAEARTRPADRDPAAAGARGARARPASRDRRASGSAFGGSAASVASSFGTSSYAVITQDASRPSRSRERRREAFARREIGAPLGARVGDQCRRRSIAACPSVRHQTPIAQRGSGSPGYHLPCPECRNPPGAKRAARRRSSVSAELALLRRQRRVVPLRPFHVVDRNERRLAALRQAHVVLREIGIDPPADLTNRRPLLVGVGLGDARILVHAGHAHREREIDLAHVGVADHRRGVAGIGGARERNVAFAREQSRRRIEPDPAGARQDRPPPTREGR